jgi:zinc transport system substrate-binding protein
MKRSLIKALFLFIILLLLSGCSQENADPAEVNTKTDKIQIVATLFPQYDFARQIAGDKAEVTMLLPPGMESHSYEPTPSDVMKIHDSDLFLYTGEEMEAWAQKLVESMDDSNSIVVNVSKGIDLARTEDLEEHGHDEEGEDHEHEKEAGHSHVYDPHIWTDPVLAKTMVANILDGLCLADPSNSDYYRKNAERYLIELDNLDKEFTEIASKAKRDKIIFGSRFAFYYFVNRYGIEYDSAFDSCSSETEPSTKKIAALMDEVKSENIPVIYYAEIEEPKTAKSIAEETGARLLLLHSCHNVTKDEFERGETYLSLMKQNAENLKEGLGE